MIATAVKRVRFQVYIDCILGVVYHILQWPDSMFKVVETTNCMLITSSPKMVEEIRKAPEHDLSSTMAIEEEYVTDMMGTTYRTLIYVPPDSPSNIYSQ